MEFNRCSRCGAFFMTENNICPNCEPKDNCDKFGNKLVERDKDGYDQQGYDIDDYDREGYHKWTGFNELRI